jgi:hypothetical protein
MPPILRKQLHPQRILDQLHLMADGGVGEAEFIGGIADRLATGGSLKPLQRLERGKLPEIDLVMHRGSVWGIGVGATGKFYLGVGGEGGSDHAQLRSKGNDWRIAKVWPRQPRGTVRSAGQSDTENLVCKSDDVKHGSGKRRIARNGGFMTDYRYTFWIDAFTPETIPMARLAEYLAVLSSLVGHNQSTHFERLEEGSAQLVYKIDSIDAPKVELRLARAGESDAPKDLSKALDALDNMLANDNAVGELRDPNGAVIIPFPGRDRPKALSFPAFRQEGSIDGQIVSIGGKDATAHVIIQDGAVTYSNIKLTRDMARELRNFLYEQKVRLVGSGRWERSPDGIWKLLDFTVGSFQILDDASLTDVLESLRETPDNGLMSRANIYDDLMSLRLGGGELH